MLRNDSEQHQKLMQCLRKAAISKILLTDDHRVIYISCLTIATKIDPKTNEPLEQCVTAGIGNDLYKVDPVTMRITDDFIGTISDEDYIADDDVSLSWVH